MQVLYCHIHFALLNWFSYFWSRELLPAVKHGGGDIILSITLSLLVHASVGVTLNLNQYI